MALVTVSEAARLLGVNKSTVSRQLGRVFPNRGTAERPLIDPEEARAGRAKLNTLKARNRGPELGYEELVEQPAADAPEERPAAKTTALAGAHAEEKRVRAELLKLQLAEKLGQTCDRAGVEEGAREMAGALQELLSRRNRSLAESLAGMADPNEIEIMLEEADGQLLERLQDMIQAQLAPAAGADDAAAA